MPVAISRKTRCPLCGTKNDSTVQRCHICTRPLPDRGDERPLASAALYDEALWSTPVNTTVVERRKTNPALGIALIAILALGANYLYFKKGPDWAHIPVPLERGFSWAERRDAPDFVVDLPGEPMILDLDGTAAGFRARSVWVDSQWNAVLDADTQSSGASMQARRDAEGLISVASGPLPADIATTLPAIVSAMGPGSTIDGATLGASDHRPGDPFDATYTMSGHFIGWPDPAGQGTVRATASVREGRLYVATTFVLGGDDPALHRRLVRTFHPGPHS
ncbi:MAG: hypothetical protein R2698_09135 [Microthrixaceae bacterium]